METGHQVLGTQGGSREGDPLSLPQTLGTRENRRKRETWRPPGQRGRPRQVCPLPLRRDPEARDLGLEAEGRPESCNGERRLKRGPREKQSLEMEEWNRSAGEDAAWRGMWEWGGPPLGVEPERNPVKSPCCGRWSCPVLEGWGDL